eukprot:1296779-Prymnesium_polylepis.1
MQLRSELEMANAALASKEAELQAALGREEELQAVVAREASLRRMIELALAEPIPPRTTVASATFAHQPA